MVFAQGMPPVPAARGETQSSDVPPFQKELTDNTNLSGFGLAMERGSAQATVGRCSETAACLWRAVGVIDQAHDCAIT